MLPGSYQKDARTGRRWLVVLCCVSIMRATPAHGMGDLSLGVGWSGDCSSTQQVEDDGDVVADCREGPRAEMGLGLFTRGSSPRATLLRSESAPGSKRIGSGGDCGSGGNCGGGGGNAGELAVIIIAVILIIVVAYGIIWGFAALAAAETSVSLYVSYDHYEKTGLPEEYDGPVEKGSMRRWGLQATMFPAASGPFRVHVGFGPASWQQIAGEGGRVYRDGFSSKVGLGLGPRPGNDGVYGTVEGEYLVLRAQTFKDLWRNNVPSTTSNRRLTTSGVIGYTFAW